jgi:hypothetical protein
VIDLDETLRLARAMAATWSSVSALHLAREIGRDPGWTIDWDAGAGESWARLINDGRVVAFVSVVLPLVIIEESAARIGTQYETALPIVVADLEAPVLSASRKALDDAFGESDRFDVIELTQFSANDLWYATI